MNKIRRKYIIDTANDAIITLNKGTYRTISRERIIELVNMLTELFQEVDDLGNYKELIPKLADDVWAVAKKLEFSTECEELKTISGCLHDIRAGHKTDWYKKFEVKK